MTVDWEAQAIPINDFTSGVSFCFLVAHVIVAVEILLTLAFVKNHIQNVHSTGFPPTYLYWWIALLTITWAALKGGRGSTPVILPAKRIYYNSGHCELCYGWHSNWWQNATSAHHEVCKISFLYIVTKWFVLSLCSGAMWFSELQQNCLYALEWLDSHSYTRTGLTAVEAPLFLLKVPLAGKGLYCNAKQGEAGRWERLFYPYEE